eukprot:467895_1
MSGAESVSAAGKAAYFDDVDDLYSRLDKLDDDGALELPQLLDEAKTLKNEIEGLDAAVFKSRMVDAINYFISDVYMKKVKDLSSKLVDALELPEFLQEAESLKKEINGLDLD